MRNIRIDTIDQRLISGESKRPLKSGVVYKKYPKIPIKWSDPAARDSEMRIWFNMTTRVMKVRPNIGHLYSFTPDTIATTTTTTSTSSSTSSTVSTSSSSTISSTTTTTV